MDVESEIKDLKRHVGDLEGAVNVIAGKLGSVHPEILALSSASTEHFDKVEETMGHISLQLDEINSQIVVASG